jgi:hypothetical protein
LQRFLIEGIFASAQQISRKHLWDLAQASYLTGTYLATTPDQSGQDKGLLQYGGGQR